MFKESLTSFSEHRWQLSIKQPLSFLRSGCSILNCHRCAKRNETLVKHPLPIALLFDHPFSIFWNKKKRNNHFSKIEMDKFIETIFKTAKKN